MHSDSAAAFGPLGPDIDCLVVIVTHGSEKYIQWCIDGLASARSRLAIRIVDSGSPNTAYLNALTSTHPLDIILRANIGFVAANNLAIESLADTPWVLFLNPDARIEGDVLDEILRGIASASQSAVGAWTVPLIRFDIEARRSLAIYDSVGISSTWYGRWRDLLAGHAVANDPARALRELESPEAICGAFLLVRSAALAGSPDSTASPGFERTYFMYKEDIELSLRLRKQGWKLRLLSRFEAFHCRGWNKRRRAVPYWARAESARNDVDIALRYRRLSLPFAVFKFLWVKVAERA